MPWEQPVGSYDHETAEDAPTETPEDTPERDTDTPNTPSDESGTSLQPTEGLEGYWAFDSISDRTIPDISGHGHNGTKHGDPQQIPGAVGQALSFDGEDDFVEVDMTRELQTRGSFTIEAWIKTTESTTGGTPLGLYTYDGSGRGEGTHINANSDTISFQARHSSGYGQPGGGAKNDPYYHIPGEAPEIVPDQWHHTALKYDKQARMIGLYVDGEKGFSLEAPKDPRVDDSFLAIGARPDSEAGSASVKNHFAGGVDEVVVYTQALSDATIQQHANRGGSSSPWTSRPRSP